METPRIADAARGLRHVFLRDLVLPASIGVHPHEHAADDRPAGEADEPQLQIATRRPRLAFGRVNPPSNFVGLQ